MQSVSGEGGRGAVPPETGGGGGDPLVTAGVNDGSGPGADHKVRHGHCLVDALQGQWLTVTSPL